MRILMICAVILMLGHLFALAGSPCRTHNGFSLNTDLDVSVNMSKVVPAEVVEVTIQASGAMSSCTATLAASGGTLSATSVSLNTGNNYSAQVDWTAPATDGIYNIVGIAYDSQNMPITDAETITVYIVSALTFPDICAGGKNDTVHQGPLVVIATADGSSVADVPVDLEFDDVTNAMADGYKPTLTSTSITTADNGMAEVLLKSGKAIKTEDSYGEVTVFPSSHGTTFPGITIPIEEPVMDISITNSLTGEDLQVLYVDGTQAAINTVLRYNDQVVVAHNITIYFKFFTEIVPHPYTDIPLYSGTASAIDPEDPCQHTRYGKFLTSTNGTTDADGLFNCLFETGTQEGYIYFYCTDQDVDKQ